MLNYKSVGINSDIFFIFTLNCFRLTLDEEMRLSLRIPILINPTSTNQHLLVKLLWRLNVTLMNFHLLFFLTRISLRYRVQSLLFNDYYTSVCYILISFRLFSPPDHSPSICRKMKIFCEVTRCNISTNGERVLFI